MWYSLLLRTDLNNGYKIFVENYASNMKYVYATSYAEMLFSWSEPNNTQQRIIFCPAGQQFTDYSTDSFVP